VSPGRLLLHEVLAAAALVALTGTIPFRQPPQPLLVYFQPAADFKLLSQLNLNVGHLLRTQAAAATFPVVLMAIPNFHPPPESRSVQNISLLH